MKYETAQPVTHQSSAHPQAERQRIHIEFAHSSAQTVEIAGTFNNWRPYATPMIALGQGRWAKDLMLPPGTYEYCLVVDGITWIPDPAAKETASASTDPATSVLRVPPKLTVFDS
jgi:1,4-alpha-glucan branching enzyme